jgi:RHS repeat-associated protein
VRHGNTITWSSYNYPTVINGANKSLTFSYGPNRERYRQVYVSGSVTETTVYVGGLLEKVTVAGGTTDWRHYVKVGSQTIAIVSRLNTGANTTRYVLEDHQGSPSRLTEINGASYVQESFTAFGARRDPGTWSDSCLCDDLTKIKDVSRRGYTGHEAIGGVSMGLNHMNGRVQDAITGRFLSADPQGVSADFTQSWNRYSYVMNNPLSSTDPSGFFSCKSIDHCNWDDTNFEFKDMEEVTISSWNDPMRRPYDGIEFLPGQQQAMDDWVKQLAANLPTITGTDSKEKEDKSEPSPQERKLCGSGSPIDPSHPSLGFVGNVIRNQLDTDLSKDLFENYWNSGGDVRLSTDQFGQIVRSAQTLTPTYTSEIVTSYRSVLTRNTYSFYGTQFANSVGSGMIFRNQAGTAVGFYDGFDLDSKDWGQRPYWKEALVRTAAAAASVHGAKPFNVSYGSCRKPK